MSDTLQHLAARHALHQLSADDMRSAVEAWMNEGFYDDICLEALDSKPARLEEVQPAFRLGLQHQGVDVPTEQGAIQFLIRYHLQRIASGRVRPWEGVSQLAAEVFLEEAFSANGKTYVGDAHGLHHLVGLYWALQDQLNGHGPQEYSYVPGDTDEGGTLALKRLTEPSEEHQQMVVDQAKQWLQAHGHAAISSQAVEQFPCG